MPAPIFHVDMDAFFAAVEVRADPRLSGKALLVGGGPPGREVVTTASYPARRFGIRSGMSLREGRLRCPEALFLPVDPARYLSASESLLRIFERFTPAVEPASIDEVFLDLAGISPGKGGFEGLAVRIQETVLREEGLSCSIGIGANKLQAKMATGLRKPAGLTRLLPGDFERIFGPRSPGELWGVGPESTAALRLLGIETVSQLAEADPELLAPVFHGAARILVRMARGEGGGRVVPCREVEPVRSMGHEITFPRDESDVTRLERHLLLLADKLSRRLRRGRWAGQVVTLKLKWHDRTVITRQTALTQPIDDDENLYETGRRLLRENRGGRAVRLIGLNVGHLVRSRAVYPLLMEDRRRRQFLAARDRVRDRFGDRTIMPAGVLALIQEGSSRGHRRR